MNAKHQQNLNAMKFLRPLFGDVALSDLTAEAIEDYLAERLRSGRRVHTKFGLQLRGTVKPATVHQEFRILSHILNVAVKQKRLSDNPCRAVEFPVSVAKSTRKPHYMSASEQAKIEFAAPNYVRKKGRIDLENGIVYIADSKTVNGIGDMPMTSDAKGRISAANRGDAGRRVPVPEPEPDRLQTAYHQSAEGLGGNAEEGECTLLRALRDAAYLRYQCNKRS